MPAIDIPHDEDESNDEVIKRLANTPGQFPAIGVASTAKPILTSQTGKAIPTGRVPGISGTINPDNGIYNQPPPGQPGVASLWAKAENIHNPVLRVLGKIGAGTARAIDTAGSIAAPAIATRVPGSTLNERFQENRQLGRETQESENTQREATTAEAQERTKEMPAKAELERAQAQAALRPKVDKPEDVAKLYADAVNEAVTAGRDPNTDPKVGQLADAVQRIQKQPTEKQPNDFEQFYGDWLKDNHFPDTSHNRLMARTAYAKAGQPFGQQHLDIAIKNQELHAGEVNDKKVAPYRQIVETASEAHQLKEMADAGNAPADVDLALAFFKTMRGQGGSIRFTQQEQKMILGARNTGQDLLALSQKVIGGGQPLTPDQRAKMVAVIDMHAKVAQEAMDRIQGGGGNQEAAPAGGGEHTSFKVGNDIYDIPPDKVDAFKKKFPSAVQQ